MKKLVSAFLLAASVMTGFSNTAVVDGIEWSFTVSGGNATLGIQPTDRAVPVTTAGDLVVPGSLLGYPVTRIWDCAFKGCSGLTSISIPASVASIKSAAFIGCSGLEEFVVDASNSRYSSANGLLLSKDGTELVHGVNGSIAVPASVTQIGDYAFADLSGLTSVSIPASVENICRLLVAGIAFSGCSAIEEFSVSPLNPTYSSANRLLLSKDGTTLWSGVNGNVTIPASVMTISSFAFSGRSGLTSVFIPSGVTTIGAEAFCNCSALTSISIPTSVTNIWDSAFRGCSGLTSITIPDGVTSIGDEAFYGCSSLQTLYLPESFRGNTGSLGIPSGCTVVFPSGAPLSVSTSSLPTGTVGMAYSATLAATGGPAPYSWNATGLPAGLSLSSSGVLSGTPTASGSFSVSVTVTDASGSTATRTVSLAVAAPAVADDPVLNLSARQRYPWNGKVDVSFSLSAGASEYYLAFAATNRATGAAIPVRTIFDAGGAAVTPRTAFAPGAVSLVWDAGADAPGLVADEVALSVVAVPPPPLYLVVDLSAGADAASYPVSHLADVPAGGWTDEYKTTKLVLRRIEPGMFTMGAPAGEVGRYDDYEAQHEVTLTKAFWIGVFELTQRQWELVMGNKPSYFSNASYSAARPVEQVPYDDIRGSSSGAQWPASSAVDASSFMGRLRARTGLDFDLPTEAQWEYACRAGTTTALNSGKNLTDTGSDANMDEVGRYWYNGGSGFSSSCTTANGTAKVGSYLPNAWGLYDMHGNVWEWCLDWSQSSLGTSAVTDPKGASSGSYRVLRGGSWYSIAQYCRSAYRKDYYYPSRRDDNLGFRPVSILP